MTARNAMWLVIGLTLGAALGAGLATSLGARARAAISEAEASRYTRAMQCFAPPMLAIAALRERSTALQQPDQSNEVILREKVFVQASLAALLQKQGDSASQEVWRHALESCKETNLADCSQAALSSYAQKICSKP